jgi:glutathione-regulated potassium-efflux system protein KefB
MRETFESAMAFSSAALRQLGVADAEVLEIAEDIRRRDAERLQLQLAGDIQSGINLMHGGRWTPAPLTRPKKAGKAMNEEAADAIEEPPSIGPRSPPDPRVPGPG